MSRFDTTGSGGIPVGPARFHLNGDGCSHRYNNVCPNCAQLTDEETAALRKYFDLLAGNSKSDQADAG